MYMHKLLFNFSPTLGSLDVKMNIYIFSHSVFPICTICRGAFIGALIFIVSQFGFFQETLRQGLEYNQFIWEMIPDTRGMRKGDREEKEVKSVIN